MNKIYKSRFLHSGFIGLFLMIFSGSVVSSQPEKMKIRFLDYFFENGSVLNWKIQGDTIIKISLLPDYERESLNRQTDHWYFKLVAGSGTHVKLMLSKMMADVYNGKEATDWWNYKDDISCYISYDRKTWEPVKTSKLLGKELLVDFTMKQEEVFIARLPVYTVSDLERLEKKIADNSLIKIINIGQTLENRPLEIIRMGDPGAKYSVIIRARAHPWEPGGSWIVEGLITKFLSENSEKWKKTFCIYIMPMGNKDGVYRGMTRFNIAGMDLNRKWDKMSDPLLCPEKYFFEKFIEGLISQGIRPSLAIDIHNDDFGGINLATHSRTDTLFIKRMQLFEKLMREKTSFSEDVKYSWEAPGQPETFVLFETGLYRRYGIEAMVYELNANWIGSLGKMPTQYDWLNTGGNMNKVFYEYLTGTE